MLRLISARPTALLLVGFLAVDTATQLAFKSAADSIGDMPIGGAFLATAAGTLSAWLAVFFYIATYAFWMLLLKDMDLSRAFPLTALSYVTVPLLAWLAFGEAINARTIAGIALILAGVYFVGGEAEGAAETNTELDPCGKSSS